MSNNCSKYQDDLIEVFYDEKPVNEEIKKHMENCKSCRVYLQELEEMKIELDNIEEEVPIDYKEISQAFATVEERQVKKTNLISLGIFVLLSTLLMGSVLGLVLHGYGKEVIYFQLTTYMIIPFALPIMIKFRKLKEGYNE